MVVFLCQRVDAGELGEVGHVLAGSVVQPVQAIVRVKFLASRGVGLYPCADVRRVGLVGIEQAVGVVVVLFHHRAVPLTTARTLLR